MDLVLIVTIIGSFLTLIYGVLKVDGIQRMVDKGSIWNARCLRTRAVALLEVLRGPKFRDMMKTYPWWDLEDQVYVGRRLITPLTIRAEQASLDMARIGAKLATQEVWFQPYDRKSIIDSYDEVISTLQYYIDDPDRYENRLKPTVEIFFLISGFILAIMLAFATR
jgi:hypothetical protein